MRVLPVLALVACEPAAISVDSLDGDPGEGWATTPSETWTGTSTEPVDPWAGALLTVIEPAAGEVLTLGATNHFEAVITLPDGTAMPVDPVAFTWISDLAPNWFETAASFDTDALPGGIHTFTATAELPNGALLQHSVGGVRVQHAYAGTYAGLIEVDGAVANIPISCIGAGLVVVEHLGEEGTGDADCIVSILTVDVPLHLVYELDIAADATITGTVGVDLLGWFTYNFDATGALDPTATMEVSFSGEVPLMGPLNGTSSLERISLDTL